MAPIHHFCAQFVVVGREKSLCLFVLISKASLHTHFLFFFQNSSKHANFHFLNRIQHEKRINMSTNKPSIGQEVLEMQYYLIFEKQSFDF